MARSLYTPAWLDATGRAAFRHAVSVLEELGEDPKLSAGAIKRYASAVSMAAELRRLWRADGYPGPPAAVIVRAERQAHELGESLGLTPMARRRMARGPGLHAGGRPQGAASAPDRAAPPKRRTRKVVSLRDPDAFA